MSWGGQPPQQQQQFAYGQPGQQQRPPAYGQPGQQPPNGAPQYGAPPGQNPAAYGAPQGYGGAPPPQQGYRPPPPQQYGGAPPPQQYGGAPPQGYGGAPPSQGGYGAPPGGAPHGAPAAQPPPGVGPELWGWFQSVDADRSGKITSTELQQALMNGNWSPFNPETCRLMIGMFDKDRNGTIDIYEFAALWKYIQEWKGCFDRHDTDKSGKIEPNELGNALNTFGYCLTPQFSQLVVRVYDRQHGGRSIQFDAFIQACVLLKSLTDKFRAKDTQQNGSIRITYEEFLEMVLDTKLTGK